MTICNPASWLADRLWEWFARRVLPVDHTAEDDIVA